MPELQGIAGHTTCRGIAHYLEGKEGDRVLAQDFINITKDHNGPDDLEWWKQMDATRRLAGNDKGRVVKGVVQRPMTFDHIVVSPDPRDDIDLVILRECVTEWAQDCFPNYEIAITYHDDNVNRIPHAHVVINNTNLVNLKRFTTEHDRKSLREANATLQNIALAHGLRGFSSDHHSLTDEEMERLGKTVGTRCGEHGEHWHDPAQSHVVPPRQRVPKRVVTQQRRRTTVSDHMEQRQQWSWKEEMQDAMDVALRLTHSEQEYRQVLAQLGIRVTDNAAHTDWLYTCPTKPGMRVTGRTLGRQYERDQVRMRYATGYAVWYTTISVTHVRYTAPQPRITPRQRDEIVSHFHVIGSKPVGEGITCRMCVDLLDYNYTHNIKSLADYGHGAEARARRRLAEELGLFDEAGIDAAQARLTADIDDMVDAVIRAHNARGHGGYEYGHEQGRGGSSYQSQPGYSQPDYGDRGISR